MAEEGTGPTRPPSGARRPEANPRWRQGYDAVEREVAPRLDAVVRSDQFAHAVGLLAHLQHLAREQVARSTRQALHLLNLPAASDVTRVLNELGRLEQQVRELSHRIDEQEVNADAEPARGDDRQDPA